MVQSKTKHAFVEDVEKSQINSQDSIEVVRHQNRAGKEKPKIHHPKTFIDLSIYSC